MPSKHHLRFRTAVNCAAAVMVLALGSTVVGQPSFDNRWHVDASATGDNNGFDWANAFTDLQDALAEAMDTVDESDEIWVAAGTYYPDGGTGDQSASFFLVDDATLYAGFLGTNHPTLPDGETDLTQRNPELNTTILSGDIGTPGDESDNSFHVVRATNVGPTAALNGFTITLGRLSANFGEFYGGGLYVEDANPNVVRCTFEHNEGGSSTAGAAVGVFNDITGEPIRFVNCVFRNNSANNHGGAIQCGGQLSDIAFDNCVFNGNFVVGAHGGAVGLVGAAAAIFTNCTFSGNAGSNEGGAFSLHDSSSLTLRNCIVWGNCPEQDQINVEGGTVTVSFSDTQTPEPWPGLGNINDDPAFLDPDGPDDVACTGDEDLRLHDGSPCIDSGRNTLIPLDSGDVDDDGVTNETLPLDLDLNERVRAGTVDMGPFEFFCAGDVDDSGGVDIVDFLALLAAWGPCPAPPAGCPADLDGNGDVDVVDFLALLADWGCGDPAAEPFPASAQECIDRYWPNVEEVAACVTSLELIEEHEQ